MTCDTECTCDRERQEDCPVHGIAAWYRDRYAEDPTYNFGD